MTLYLVWLLHESPELLAVCATKEIAQSVIDDDKKNGNHSSGFQSCWFINEVELLTEKK